MDAATGTVGRRLEVEWLAFVAVAAGVAVVGVQLVSAATDPAAGRRWVLVTGAVLAYEVGYLRYHLSTVGREHPDGRGARSGLPDATLGIANAVTLLRGVLYACAAGFLLVPPSSPLVRWAPGVCYGAGAALDFVDGYLARRNGRTTELGARLDHAFDTLGLLAAPLVGVVWGRLPVWYLSISAARYVFRGGLARRRYAGEPTYPLPESRLRRRLAALQMAFVAAALVPVAPASVVHPVATIVMLPSLAGFVRDWLAVTGRLPQREE